MWLSRGIWAVIGILALLVPWQPQAYAAACAPGEPPEIKIDLSESEPRFDYTLSREDLKRFPGNNSVPMLAVYDITVNALSTGRMKIRHGLSFRRSALSDKQVCVYVSGVNVSIHTEPVIYMAKELRTAPCEYKEYLEHELKHVDVDRKLLADYSDVIRRNIDFAFPQPDDFVVGPVPSSLRKDAEEELTYNVTGVLLTTIDSMLRERGFRQREIDSVSEYGQLGLSCGLEAGTAPPPSGDEAAAYDINKPF